MKYLRFLDGQIVVCNQINDDMAWLKVGDTIESVCDALHIKYKGDEEDATCDLDSLMQAIKLVKREFNEYIKSLYTINKDNIERMTLTVSTRYAEWHVAEWNDEIGKFELMNWKEEVKHG